MIGKGAAKEFDGSAALATLGTPGNADTGDLSVAGRIICGQGDGSRLIGVADG